MATKTRRRYSEEFKAQALEILQTGKPVSELAEELGISSDLLYSWRRSARGGGEALAVARQRDQAGAADDLRALRRENAQLRMENDILKKAAIILGSKNPPNCAK